MIKRVKCDMDSYDIYFTEVNKFLCLRDKFLCLRGLNKYFDLDDKPKKITVLLSDKPMKESHKIIEVCQSAVGSSVTVQREKRAVAHLCYYDFYDYIKTHFDGECYIAIEA